MTKEKKLAYGRGKGWNIKGSTRDPCGPKNALKGKEKSPEGFENTSFCSTLSDPSLLVKTGKSYI